MGLQIMLCEAVKLAPNALKLEFKINNYKIGIICFALDRHLQHQKK
jgi:hypothetical protein